MPRVKKSVSKKTKIKQAVKKTAKPKQVKKGLIIPVYDTDGKEKGDLELPKEIFAIEANPKLLAQYVRVYLANQRRGTASTKTRGEVVGSTRKIYRQKGTGKARHGDIKAPIFTGGGIVGGPKPRDYSLKLNKQQKRKALFGALSLKVKEKGVLGLSDEFYKIEPKTKFFADFLKKTALNKERIIIVFSNQEKNNLILAGRNIPNIEFINTQSINAYEVLKNKKILFMQSALEVFLKHFLKNETN